MAVIPRDAATLILLRQAAPPGSRMEVLMLQRHANSSFLPGACVFPGGAVEEADYSAQAERVCHGLNPAQARRVAGDVSSPGKALGFFVAAIREAFEEAGILLVCGESSGLVALSDQQKLRFARCRRRVHDNPHVFASLIEEEGLKIAADNLFYFAHWITPEASPIRFDARFFVAAAPLDQEASFDGLETTAARWISPRELLKAHQKGDLYLPVPTLSSVSALAGFSSVEDVITLTHDREITVNYG
jgi:8-oxo-dGTP pyrophosphatase MutT (NUDIX family)